MYYAWRLSQYKGILLIVWNFPSWRSSLFYIMEISMPEKTLLILRQGPGYMHIQCKMDMNLYRNGQIQFVHGGLHHIDLSSNSSMNTLNEYMVIFRAWRWHVTTVIGDVISSSDTVLITKIDTMFPMFLLLLNILNKFLMVRGYSIYPPIMFFTNWGLVKHTCVQGRGHNYQEFKFCLKNCISEVLLHTVGHFIRNFAYCLKKLKYLFQSYLPLILCMASWPQNLEWLTRAPFH